MASASTVLISRAEWFRAKVGEQRMLGDVAPGGVMPEHRAEPAGVVQPQFLSAVDFQDKVVVFPEVRAARADAQAAGHAEVQDERTRVACQHEVFRPPPHVAHCLAADFVDLAADRPAHAGVPHLDGADAAASEVGRDSPAGGFDFWKLGHAPLLPALGKNITLYH